MKNKNFLRYIILLVGIMSFCFAANAQNRLLSDMPSGRGVSKVYLSKELIKLGGGATAQATAAGRYMAYVKDMDGIEAYNCINPQLRESVESRFRKIIRSSKAEELLSSEDSFESSYIYLVNNSKKGGSSAMIIYNSSPQEIDIIVIHGKIDPSAVKILPTY